MVASSEQGVQHCPTLHGKSETSSAAEALEFREIAQVSCHGRKEAKVYQTVFVVKQS
jgi:hypothetical protein